MPNSNNLSRAMALSVGVLAMAFLISYLVLAWTEPAAPPPTPLVPAPINVGPASQTKTGLLGIGDLDSNYGLTIATSTGGIKITNISSNTSQLSFYVEDQSNDPTPFVIDMDGNVGIGTTPETPLHVKGVDNVGGITLEGAWGDIVFKDEHVDIGTLWDNNGMIRLSTKTGGQWKNRLVIANDGSLTLDGKIKSVKKGIGKVQGGAVESICADNETGCGIQISDDGGFFDQNDGWITGRISSGLKLRNQANNAWTSLQAGSGTFSGNLTVGGGIGIGESRVSGYYINTPSNFDVTTGGALSANSANITGNLTVGGNLSVGSFNIAGRTLHIPISQDVWSESYIYTYTNDYHTETRVYYTNGHLNPRCPCDIQIEACGSTTYGLICNPYPGDCGGPDSYFTTSDNFGSVCYNWVQDGGKDKSMIYYLFSTQSAGNPTVVLNELKDLVRVDLWSYFDESGFKRAACPQGYYMVGIGVTGNCGNTACIEEILCRKLYYPTP